MIIENKNLYDEHLKKLVISSYIKNQPYSLLSYLNHKILESYVDFIVESSEEFIFTKYSGNSLLGVCFLSTNVNSIFVRFLFYLVKTKKIKYLFKKIFF